MRKIFNWLIDKWLAGFITGSIFFTAKLYADLPAESKANFFRFNWLTDLLRKEVAFSTVLIVIIVIIMVTRIEKAILRAKLIQASPIITKRQAPSFDSYRRDTFGVYKTTWVWNYNYNEFDSNVTIVDLKPVCKRCGTPMEIVNTPHSDWADCHKCRLDGRPNSDRITESVSDVHKEIVRKITNHEYQNS